MIGGKVSDWTIVEAAMATYYLAQEYPMRTTEYISGN